MSLNFNNNEQSPEILSQESKTPESEVYLRSHHLRSLLLATKVISSGILSTFSHQAFCNLESREPQDRLAHISKLLNSEFSLELYSDFSNSINSDYFGIDGKSKEEFLNSFAIFLNNFFSASPETVIRLGLEPDQICYSCSGGLGKHCQISSNIYDEEEYFLDENLRILNQIWNALPNRSNVKVYSAPIRSKIIRLELTKAQLIEALLALSSN